MTDEEETDEEETWAAWEKDPGRAPKLAQIRALFPDLMRLRRQHLDHIAYATVVLPAALNPGAYEGPGATNAPAYYLGMPVEWSDDGELGIRIGNKVIALVVKDDSTPA